MKRALLYAKSALDHMTQIIQSEILIKEHLDLAQTIAGNHRLLRETKIFPTLKTGVSRWKNCESSAPRRKFSNSPSNKFQTLDPEKLEFLLHESVRHELEEAFSIALRTYSADLGAGSVFHGLGSVRSSLRRVIFR